ncbi:MAG: glycosyltransferase [Myxococcales bacterium]|nr:glycosyltransferase [Myxococcales bacterium]
MSAREPLVSVMMPCFNAERTLPMALASLRAQTYDHWEAVVVDDGSTDRSSEILNAFGDDRLRVERFDTNRGRGAARHRCLEMARGDLLSFLDADDWLFPNKLSHQVTLMREHPEITVLGAACVITDATGEAVGQTRTDLGPNQELAIDRFDRLGPPPVGFPPCMVRMDDAQLAQFNPAFRRSQDSDFLLQVMLGKAYAMSATPLYAYSQAEAASLDKTLEGYRYRLRCYGQYTERYPLRSRTQMAKTVARMGVYKAASLLHAEQHLIARRWEELSPEAEKAFRDAKQTVVRAVGALREVS